MKFDDVQAEIEHHLSECVVTKPVLSKHDASKAYAHVDRFRAVEQKTGVPALWIMPVWIRENPSFDAYLGNGDPISHMTVHVPKHRGPFHTWEDGAIDALKLDNIDQVTEWSWSVMAYEWELWNGLGPRHHGRPSGYVWAGTNIYAGGKYVADGVWSPRTWDTQIGCVAIAKALVQLEPSLEDKLI